MKLINILIIFLLTITACFAEFGSEVIVDGTGIQTDDDAELNSLDVLLYVKSSTLEPHQANTPVVIKPESGSTTDDVLEIQSEDGTAITTFDNSGGLQVDSLGVGCTPSGVSGEAKADVYLPCNIGGDLQLRLLADTDAVALQNSAGSDTFTFSLDGDDRVMSFLGGTNTGTLTWDDSAAAMEFSTGIQTVDGAGISIGGEAPDENYLAFSDNGSSSIGALSSDELAILHTSVYLYILKGTGTGTTRGSILGNIARFYNGKFNSITNEADDGPPSAIYGITYREVTAPSAPSSGATLYTNSSNTYLEAIKSDSTLLDIERKLFNPSVLAASLGGEGQSVTQTGIAAATWTKFTLGLTADDANDFAWDAVNERFYLSTSGVTNRKFTVDAGASVSTSAINHDVEFVMYKNGVAVDSTYIKRYISSNDVGALSTPGTVELSTNDYIELYVKAENATSMTFESFSLVLKEY